MIQEFCFPDGVKIVEINLTESMTEATRQIKNFNF